jgi:hypothetical protein
MFSRILIFVLAASLVWSAAKKITGSGRGENQDLILNVTVYGDPESVKEIVGDDLGGHYVVAQVNVQPKYGKEIVIDRDDFILRTDANGERTGPLAPNQIAGKNALVLTQTKESLGQNSEPRRGWSIGGGMIGTGNGGSGRGAEAKEGKAATMEQGDKENPLKKVLEQKMLPEGKLEKPVSGLLYFPLEGQKLKHLELIYGAKETRVSMRFK